MSFIRTSKQENPFVQMDKYFLEDPTISFEAKGILGYILSKPDSWTIRRTDLIKRSASGRNRVESALLELMAAGYMNWYQDRTEGGTFGDWIYNVYERPEFNPDAEKCKEEGLSRINHKKSVNKKKNQPKADNPHSESPKADYPHADNPNTDNPPYSNNDFRDIELSNIDLNKEEEEAASFLVELFEKNVHKSNDTIETELAKWAKLLPVEVIANEIKYAAKKGATSFSYIEKALIQDKENGVNSIVKLDKKRKDYAESQKRHSKGRSKYVREEVIPEFMKDGKQQEGALEEVSAERKAQLNNEKAEFLRKQEERKAEYKRQQEEKRLAVKK